MSPNRSTEAESVPPSPVAGDCRGLNFFQADPGFRRMLALYLDPALLAHLEPHLHHLGELAGGRLNELAETADQHGPILHPRDRLGRDEEWIEYHPAYREMENIAFHQFGLHAMSHRDGVLDWPEPLPHLAKYSFQYLFVQAEFGLMCPISLSDTATYLFLRYASTELKARYQDKMLSLKADTLLKSAQFMTEKTGGSDVGAGEAQARFDPQARDGSGQTGHWRLQGEKWFCSHADADLAMVLARPEGAPQGTKGLGLFLLPKKLADGTRNNYRIVRLKDKLGTRSMASGEIRLEGAIAYPVGDLEAGFKQMLEQVNYSRLSHGVRAAAMMRRCLNESIAVARTRNAFGAPLMERPLVQQQLLKIMVPTEQALSFLGATAAAATAAEEGDKRARRLLRLLTPLYKFRACRDNVTVASAAMEMRGGCGYIEEWINPRLVRDAHIGTLWEGTSNIIALDTATRAVAKLGAQDDLANELEDRLAEASNLPGQFNGELSATLRRVVTFANEATSETECRRVTSALYHITSAILLAWESAKSGDGKRLLLSRLVMDHRLTPQDPLARANDPFEIQAAQALLDDQPLDLNTAVALLGR